MTIEGKLLLTKDWLRGEEAVALIEHLCSLSIPFEEFVRLIEESNTFFYAYSHELLTDLCRTYAVKDWPLKLPVILKDNTRTTVPHKKLIKIPLPHSSISNDDQKNGVTPVIPTTDIRFASCMFVSEVDETNEETSWELDTAFLSHQTDFTGFSKNTDIHFSKKDILHIADIINGIGQVPSTDNPPEELLARIAELEAENATLRKALEETTEQPKKSTYLMIARTLELYLEANPKHKQKNFVAQLQDGQKSIRGLSDATVNQLLADAKKVLEEERKRSAQ